MISFNGNGSDVVGKHDKISGVANFIFNIPWHSMTCQFFQCLGFDLSSGIFYK